MIFQSAAAAARVESPGQVPLRVLSTIFAVLRVLRVALLQSQGFNGWMPHSPEEYRLIFARIQAGMSEREAGYRGSLA